MDNINITKSVQELDLLEIIKKIYTKKSLVVKSILITFTIGFFIALISPKKYTAGTVFVPMALSASSSGGGLSGLASLAGINLSGSMESSDIAPNLYPEIIESIPFRQELAEVKIPYEGKFISYRQYYKARENGVLPTIKKYTIGLPGLIIKFFKGNTSNNNTFSKGENLISLSDEDYNFFKQFDNFVNINVDLKEGYIELNVDFDNPIGSAIIATKAVEILQNKVIEFKIKQASEVLKYAQQQLVVKRDLLYDAQSKLASFKDRNVYISTSIFQSQLLRLESEYNNANVVYQEVAKQVEQSKLQVSRDTPIFSILKPVVVPNISTANKLLIITIWAFLGLVLSIFYILFSENIQKFFLLLKQK
jgi:LPS O-antigen subunit length determinant protein (WzzB/FepE family)